MSADADKAKAYAATADDVRSFARFYNDLADTTEPNPLHLTFAVPLADIARRGYRDMAARYLEAAEQADEVARHYAGHAAGEDMRLSGAAS